MHLPKRISNLNPSIIFLFLAVLIGGYIRLSQVLMSPFPLNDGGLFYTMTQDLVTNHFCLPLVTTYNHLNIPYAYPPFSFYLSGLLNQVFHFDLLGIIRVLPAIVTTLCIPAFYIFAKSLVKDDFQVGLATFIFALLPKSFDWLIMGGGVTRSIGLFFSLLTITSIIKMFKNEKFKFVPITSFLASLTILSHPETALHTAAFGIVFFLYCGRNKTGVFKSILVAAITILLTSPWWVVVLANHGFRPFMGASNVGFGELDWFFRLIIFDLTGEYYIQTIGVLALIGIFVLLRKREFLLPILFIVIFISAPRSAPRSMSPVISLLASYSLELVLSAINSIKLNSPDFDNKPYLFRTRLAMFLFTILSIQWIISAYSTSYYISKAKTITKSDLSAFEWVISNTPMSSRFYLVTDQDPLFDPVSEWFPAITKRESKTTLYGSEWLYGLDFNRLYEQLQELQYCSDKSPDCISYWAEKLNREYDYVFIRNSYKFLSTDKDRYSSALVVAMANSSEFQLVYNTPQVSILKKTR